MELHERIHEVADKMDSLYILNKSKYLQQNKKSYYTRKGYLSKELLVAHLNQKTTLGVFATDKTELTTFITFDVDTKENAMIDTIDLVDVLVRHYGINKKDIHVTYSGNKGYHIELFFDRATRVSDLKLFYQDVLENSGYTEKEIEFRPSSKQGIKLPLSLNKNTMKFCNFISLYTYYIGIEELNQEESIQYLLDIEPINLDEFYEFVLEDILEEAKLFELEKDKAREFTEVTDEINITGTIKGQDREYFKAVLEAGHLLHPSTRHKISWQLPIYLRELGYDLETTQDITWFIIKNTIENPDTSSFIESDLEYARAEVIRLSELVWNSNYSLDDSRRAVRITKNEIGKILEIKQYHLKKLALSMLIHSKRYADVDGNFYMAYSTMSKMGNTELRARLKKYTEQLEELGVITIQSQNEIDKIMSKVYGMTYKKPNEYKVNIISTDKDEPYVIMDGDAPTIEQFIVQFFTFQEVKDLLPRRQLDKVRSYF